MRWFFIFSSCLFIITAAFSQSGISMNQRVPDAIKRAMMNAGVLTGASAPADLSTSAGWYLRFNRRMVVEVEKTGIKTYYCMLMNTDEGYAAYLKPEYRFSGTMCNLYPNSEEFYMPVIALTGNVMIFSNISTGTTVRKRATFGNTDVAPINFFGEEAPMIIKQGNAQRPYLSGSFQAVPYRATGANMPTFYLTCTTTSWQISANLQPLKFLGFLGVGYMKTAEGVLLSLGFENGDLKTKLVYTDAQPSFVDATAFSCEECDFIAGQRASLREQRERLEQRGARIAGRCMTEELDKLQSERERVARNLRALDSMQGRSIYDPNSPWARITSLNTYNDRLEADIHDMKKALCNFRYSQQMGSNVAAQMACVSEKIANTQRALNEMRAADAQYRTSPGEAMQAKVRIDSELNRQHLRCRY
jgi:hypothetical protein